MQVVQGVLGSLLTKLNIAAAVYRRNSVLHEWPILEVTGAAAVTAAVSYLVRISMLIIESVFGIFVSPGCFPQVRMSTLYTRVCLHLQPRVPASDLVANLFQECDPQRIDFHGLCK